MTVGAVELLEQAITTEDHAELSISTTQVRRDLPQTLFDHSSVNGHSTLTIVHADGHANTGSRRLGRTLEG